MRKNDADTVASHRGLEWAAFMMGLSNGISIDANDSGYWMTPYSAAYIQDNWRVSRKLTLNLGLRFEREGGISERYNRAIEVGFMYDAKLPITDGAQAGYATVYAANPGIGLLDPSQFKVLGGLPYLGQYHDTLTDGSKQLLPRIGMAYQFKEKTVIRAGYGWYYDTINVNNFVANQSGFSQATGTTVTTDNGLTFLGSFPAPSPFASSALSNTKNLLTDPFPVRADGTRFDVPLGNKLGLMSRVGTSWDDGNYSFWRDVKPPFQQRWRLGVQRQLRSDMVVEVAYNGALSKIPVRQRMNYLPKQYWATGGVRVQSVDDDLNRNVTNPFNIKNFASLATSDPVLYKWMSTQGFFTGTTIRKHQLLRPFPQYGTLSGLRPGVKGDDIRGNVNYGDLDVRFEKRFSKGFSSSYSYTRVFKSTVQDYYFNEFDAGPTAEPNNQTRKNRMVWDTVLDLPFGVGQRWASGGGLLNQLVGGWQFGWIWQRQCGQTFGFGNRFYYGDANKIADVWNHDTVWGNDIHQWFDPNLPFEKTSAKQPGSYHVRMLPNRFGNLVGPGIDNWDIKVTKRFRIREQMSTLFSVDFLNAFNHTNFTEPNTDPTSTNFGKLTAQRGLSRVIQFNLRFVF
jgi:hypothetical protein